MVGRRAEKQLLSETVLDPSAQGKGGVVTIEGEAGIGKSRLIGHLFDEARARGLAALTGCGDSIERSTPYQAWREVFDYLLELENCRSPEDRQERAQASVKFAAGPEAADLLPPLNPVLSTAFPETEATSGLTTPQRAEKANDILLSLLATLPPNAARKLIVLEDAHWIDSASWNLILRACREIPSVLIVIAARPMPETAPDEWIALQQAGRHPAARFRWRGLFGALTNVARARLLHTVLKAVPLRGGCSGGRSDARAPSRTEAAGESAGVAVVSAIDAGTGRL